ncbi:MAG: hypothetical protein KF774_17735 [Planctomyces sp.]|nr:hypothetical protein [Planctomyces sp.]
MPYFEFIWTDEAKQHVADNDVTPEEFEDVVLNAGVMETSRKSGLPACSGHTQDGRLLFCVFRIEDDLWAIPVTAFEIGDR